MEAISTSSSLSPPIINAHQRQLKHAPPPRKHVVRVQRNAAALHELSHHRPRPVGQFDDQALGQAAHVLVPPGQALHFRVVGRDGEEQGRVPRLALGFQAGRLAHSQAAHDRVKGLVELVGKDVAGADFKGDLEVGWV